MQRTAPARWSAAADPSVRRTQRANGGQARIGTRWTSRSSGSCPTSRLSQLARVFGSYRACDACTGEGRWRKMKGVARIRLADGSVRRAELHWYEAHGIGKKELKVKRYLG